MARMPAAVARRLNRIPTVTNGATGDQVIEDFGLFLDTHRDQPHIGTFWSDIHRGQCRPTPVHYNVDTDEFIDEHGTVLPRHDKHMFVEPEFFTSFLLERMMSGLGDPRDGDGIMPTSHLREARTRVYHLWSFRQVVVDHYEKHHKAGTLKKR